MSLRKRRAIPLRRGTDWQFASAFREAAQRERERERKTREAQVDARAKRRTLREKRTHRKISTPKEDS